MSKPAPVDKDIAKVKGCIVTIKQLRVEVVCFLHFYQKVLDGEL